MLTGDRIKNMPISMNILKEIKDTYGVPEKIAADTSYGFECDSIWIYGINATQAELNTIANKYRTQEMIESDGERDACDVVIMDSIASVNLLNDITEFFKEL